MQNFFGVFLHFYFGIDTLYVLGTKTGDAAWNEWLDKAKSLGVDEVVKAYNNAQARYDAAKK